MPALFLPMRTLRSPRGLADSLGASLLALLRIGLDGTVTISVIGLPSLEERFCGVLAGLAAVESKTTRTINRKMPEFDPDITLAHFRLNDLPAGGSSWE